MKVFQLVLGNQEFLIQIIQLDFQFHIQIEGEVVIMFIHMVKKEHLYHLVLEENLDGQINILVVDGH